MNKSLAQILPETPKPLEVTSQIIQACVDAKGMDISAIGVKKVFDLADYFVIVSGRSDRHVQGLCHKVLEALESRGLKPYSVEGLEHAHWVVIDFGDVVFHAFYGPAREHYDLEGLWIRGERLDLTKKLRS